jgi:hypothetical protein
MVEQSRWIRPYGLPSTEEGSPSPTQIFGRPGAATNPAHTRRLGEAVEELWQIVLTLRQHLTRHQSELIDKQRQIVLILREDFPDWVCWGDVCSDDVGSVGGQHRWWAARVMSETVEEYHAADPVSLVQILRALRPRATA